MQWLDASPFAVRREGKTLLPVPAGVPTPAASRPGLPYQHALDRCAQLAWAGGGQTSVATANPLHVAQLGGRLGSSALELVWLGGRPVPEVGVWGGEIVAVPTREVTMMIWTEPASQTAVEDFKAVSRGLCPGGRLAVIVAGPLAGLRITGPGARRKPTIGLLALLRLIRSASLSVERVDGFGWAPAFLWAYTSSLCERIGRPDLGDRCLVRHRELFAVSGVQAALAALTVVVARRGATTGGPRQ